MTIEARTRRTAIAFAWVGFGFLGGGAAILHQQMGGVIEILDTLGRTAGIDRRQVGSGLASFVTVAPIASVLLLLGGIILFASLIAITRGYIPKPKREQAGDLKPNPAAN